MFKINNVSSWVTDSLTIHECWEKQNKEWYVKGHQKQGRYHQLIVYLVTLKF